MLSQKSLTEKERQDGMYVLEQCMGFVWQAALRTAALLRVADHLKDEDKTAEHLAQELNVDAGYLYRVMRTLASREVFSMTDDGLFTLTPAAQFLRSDTPYSLREAVLMLTDKTLWQPAGEMTDIVKGRPVFNELFGMPFYEYWGTKKTPSGDDGFHAGMASMSSVENDMLADNYHFPENATVVDIAGGLGNLLLTVLRRNPTLHGILFDRDNVVSENSLHLLGNKSRWETIAGSFFEACPVADIYMLKYILMDWPDEKASQILHTCRKAMKASSRLLILEPLIKEQDNEQGRYEIDLLLLSGFDGGRARTEKEYADLLGHAGLKINRVIHTPSYLSIVEAVPA